MKRKLTLKAERLVDLTTEELHDVAGAQATPGCGATVLLSYLVCEPSRPATLCGCLTGEYSLNPC